MIEKIVHSTFEVARGIYGLWQVSYLIEAELLKAENFPPLKRTVQDFLNATTDFYSIVANNEMMAIIEIDSSGNAHHIQSLVVHPNHFREGLASKLIEFVLRDYRSKDFTVETGLDNAPAISLYLKQGFIEDSQFNTDHGIIKIRLSLNR